MLISSTVAQKEATTFKKTTNRINQSTRLERGSSFSFVGSSRKVNALVLLPTRAKNSVSFFSFESESSWKNLPSLVGASAAKISRRLVLEPRLLMGTISTEVGRTVVRIVSGSHGGVVNGKADLDPVKLVLSVSSGAELLLGMLIALEEDELFSMVPLAAKREGSLFLCVI